MNWDFDSIRIVRGEKVDTSSGTLLSTLREKIDDGTQLYIATNEFFNPFYFFVDFKELWDENSEWYAETMELNNKVLVEFDWYMRVEVDMEVFLWGKKQIETFNDLTNN